MVLSKTLQEKWRSPNPTLVGPLTICCNYLQMLRHFYWNKNFPGGVVHYQDLPRGGGSDLLQGICVNYLCRDMNNQLYHPRLTIWSLGQQAPEKRLAEVSGKSIWFLHFIRIITDILIFTDTVMLIPLGIGRLSHVNSGLCGLHMCPALRTVAR